MNLFAVVLVVAATFGICFLVDKGFARIFRSQAQHHSGLAVRLGKHYAVFGLILAVLGVLAVCTGISDGPVLLWGGVIVLLIGVALIVYYLSFGIFYDEDTFLVTAFGRKNITYRYADIVNQELYLVQGGNVIVELHMADRNAVSLQSGMEGAYPFLDHAFAAWCRQNGRDPESCEFHDPANSLWFPMEEM